MPIRDKKAARGDVSIYRYITMDHTLILKKNHLWNESDVEAGVIGGRLHEPVDEEALVVDHCGPGWRSKI